MIGLLMMRNDHDILPQILECNLPHFSALYVLDGSDNHAETLRLFDQYAAKVAGLYRDIDLPPQYHQPPRDGARQFLLDKIKADFEGGEWIFCLHSDEMFYDVSPQQMVDLAEQHQCDLISVRNVHFFLHSSQKESYFYDANIAVTRQIPYACFPGHLEFRAFKNIPGISYNINEMRGVVPAYGLTRHMKTAFPIRHYLYRYPDQIICNANDRFTRNWQSYGKQWYENSKSCFVDILPGYEFVRVIKEGQKIVDGILGTLD